MADDNVERERLQRMSYAGDISPTDAYRMISEDDEALLIDVRTMPEWAFVGMPDLSAVGKQVMRLSWQQFPSIWSSRTSWRKPRRTNPGHYCSSAVPVPGPPTPPWQ